MSVIFACFTTEFFLQFFTTKFKTYAELNTGKYLSIYRPLFPGKYQHHEPRYLMRNHKEEFSYTKQTNSRGYVDIEWPVKKSERECRIICLGDSFTEGDGAPYDSSYVAILRRMFKGNVSVMNAGIIGSDPFFNYTTLEEVLLTYYPDIVVQTLSTDDMISDFRVRGGFERFKEDGSVRYKQKPLSETIYALSNVSRLFFQMSGFSQTLLKGNISVNEKNKLDEMTINLLGKYNALAKEHNFIVKLVLLPVRDEVIENNYRYDFSSIIEGIKSYSNIQIIQLKDQYRFKMIESGQNISDYYWPKDGHHNSEGYAMMAECIYAQIGTDIDSLLRQKAGQH